MNGESHPNAALSEEAVRAIRKEASQGETCRALAERYGTTRTHIAKIVRRAAWRHVR